MSRRIASKADPEIVNAIVALGEASHGTREFFQMKHRLLEYLVREKGFTVFAIGANWPEALAADRYIKSGEGDARSVVANCAPSVCRVGGARVAR